MSAAAISLQGALVSALAADAELLALLGGAARIFDSPPQGARPPYVVIARHDVFPRDGDEAPGFDHRLVLEAWAPEASRKPVLAMAGRVAAVALGAALAPEGLVVTHRVVERTETAIDLRSGFARARVRVRVFTEPAG